MLSLNHIMLSISITTLIAICLMFYKILLLEQQVEVSKTLIYSLEKKSQALEISERLASAMEIQPTPFFNLGVDDLILAFSAMCFFGTVLFFKKNFVLLDIVQKQNSDLYTQNLVVQKNIGEIGNTLANLILVENDVLSKAALVPIELLP